MKLPDVKAELQKGFSLTELMVSMVLISIFSILMFSIFTDQFASGLIESSRVRLRAEGQYTLLNLQDELLFTIAYGEEIENRLTDSYAPVGGWQYNQDPAILVINEIAIDSTRRDDTRHIVRERVNNCETSSITSNPLAINNEIYFLDKNPDDAYYTLYRRTVTPDYDLCSIDSDGDPCSPVTADCRGNAKESTCPVSVAASDGCRPDAVMTENVVSMDITYFAEGNTVIETPSDAEKIEVTLTLGDKIYGRDIEATVTHTIRKIN